MPSWTVRTVANSPTAAEARRLSRVRQLTLAAARLALRDAGGEPGEQSGLVVGTEFGDLRSTIEFADGFLARGPAGLSPLLFPGTVMNTMAATTAIALATRGLSLTLNAPDVAGELALWRATAAVARRRADQVLAGGVDEIAPLVDEITAALGASDGRGDGAAFLVLEPLERAVQRGARALGEILGAASVALPARRHGIGRSARSSAIARALAAAGVRARDVGWIYASIGADAARARWERDLLDAAFGASRPPTTSLAPLVGRHSGLGVLHAAAAMWTARSGLLPMTGERPSAEVRLDQVPAGPGLVHGVARGGAHVALIVGPPPAP